MNDNFSIKMTDEILVVNDSRYALAKLQKCYYYAYVAL